MGNFPRTLKNAPAAAEISMLENYYIMLKESYRKRL
jgi:hypothetical protein